MRMQVILDSLFTPRVQPLYGGGGWRGGGVQGLDYDNAYLNVHPFNSYLFSIPITIPILH